MISINVNGGPSTEPKQPVACGIDSTIARWTNRRTYILVLPDFTFVEILHGLLRSKVSPSSNQDSHRVRSLMDDCFWKTAAGPEDRHSSPPSLARTFDAFPQAYFPQVSQT